MTTTMIITTTPAAGVMAERRCPKKVLKTSPSIARTWPRTITSTARRWRRNGPKAPRHRQEAAAANQANRQTSSSENQANRQASARGIRPRGRIPEPRTRRPLRKTQRRGRMQRKRRARRTRAEQAAVRTQQNAGPGERRKQNAPLHSNPSRWRRPGQGRSGEEHRPDRIARRIPKGRSIRRGQERDEFQRILRIPERIHRACLERSRQIQRGSQQRQKIRRRVRAPAAVEVAAAVEAVGGARWRWAAEEDAADEQPSSQHLALKNWSHDGKSIHLESDTRPRCC